MAIIREVYVSEKKIPAREHHFVLDGTPYSITPTPSTVLCPIAKVYQSHEGVKRTTTINTYEESVIPGTPYDPGIPTKYITQPDDGWVAGAHFIESQTWDGSAKFSVPISIEGVAIGYAHTTNFSQGSYGHILAGFIFTGRRVKHIRTNEDFGEYQSSDVFSVGIYAGKHYLRKNGELLHIESSPYSPVQPRYLSAVLHKERDEVVNASLLHEIHAKGQMTLSAPRLRGSNHFFNYNSTLPRLRLRGGFVRNAYGYLKIPAMRMQAAATGVTQATPHTPVSASLALGKLHLRGATSGSIVVGVITTPPNPPNGLPVIIGSGATPNAVIVVTITDSSGTTQTITTTSDGNGNWSVTPTTPLSEGDYTVTATGGNGHPQTRGRLKMVLSVKGYIRDSVVRQSGLYGLLPPPVLRGFTSRPKVAQGHLKITMTMKGSDSNGVRAGLRLDGFKLVAATGYPTFVSMGELLLLYQKNTVQTTVLAVMQDGVKIAEILTPAIAIQALINEQLKIQDNYTVQHTLSAAIYEYWATEQGYPETADKQETWLVNRDTLSTTTYSGYNFNSYCERNGQYYAACKDGIYLLDGNTDSGDEIKASIQLGDIDFGSTMLKSMSNCYIGVKTDGKMVLKVVANGKEYFYESRRLSEHLQQHRFTTGKGLRANYMTLELHNKDGADFELDTVQFRVINLSRRI